LYFNPFSLKERVGQARVLDKEETDIIKDPAILEKNGGAVQDKLKRTR
jgi:hypothetical protein